MQVRLFILLISVAMLFTGCPSGTDYFASGNALLTEKKYAEAKVFFEKAVQEKADDPQSWLGLGISKAQLVDHEGAIADYNKAAGKLTGAVDSMRCKVFFNRGMSHYALAHFNDCIVDMSEALKYTCSTSDAYAFRGNCHAALGDEVKAITELTASLKANPDNIWALSTRGYFNSKLGDNQSAIADLSRALKIDPSSISNWLNRGYTYLQSGDIPNAEKDFDEVLKMEPGNFGGIVYKGIVLNHQDKNTEALPYFDKAVQMEPANPTPHYYRGVTLVALGMKDEGCRELLFARDNGESMAARIYSESCE